MFISSVHQLFEKYEGGEPSNSASIYGYKLVNLLMVAPKEGGRYRSLTDREQSVVCTIRAVVCTRPRLHRQIAVVPCHVAVSDHIASLAAIFASTISTPATITVVVIPIAAQISHQILIPLGVGPVDAFLELSKIRHDRNIRVRLRQRSADGPSGLPVSS